MQIFLYTICEMKFNRFLSDPRREGSLINL